MDEVHIPHSDEAGPGERLPVGNLLSVTAMQLRDPAQRAAFLEELGKVMAQLKATPGVLAHDLFAEGQPTTYYTVTIWQDLESMRRFRNTGAHMNAMKLAPMLTGKIRSAQWMNEGTTIPSRKEVQSHLQANEHPPTSSSPDPSTP